MEEVLGPPETKEEVPICISLPMEMVKARPWLHSPQDCGVRLQFSFNGNGEEARPWLHGPTIFVEMVKKLGHGDKRVPILQFLMVKKLGHGDKRAPILQFLMVKKLGHGDERAPILQFLMVKARPWR
jgi:hypothetical protein